MKNKITLLIIVMLTQVSISAFAQVPNWLWAKAMGGTSNDHGTSVAVDDSGNVYTTGYFTDTTDFDPGTGVYNLYSTGFWDIFISKLDVNGNFVWAKAMSGTALSEGYAITTDASGNVYTTGYYTDTIDFDPGPGIFNLIASPIPVRYAFISKLTASGNFVWAKDFSSSGDSWCKSITLDTFGNIYTTGWFWGVADLDPGPATYNLFSGGHQSAFVSKLDSSGNFVWAKLLSGGGSGLDNSFGQSIYVSNSPGRNVYTSGYFEGTADFDPGAGTFNLTSAGLYDIFISKLDSSGNFVWAKTMGGTMQDASYSIAINPAGSEDVYSTGYFSATVDFDPGPGVFNLTGGGTFISKLDSSGNFVWAKRIATPSFVNALSIAVDPAGSGEVYTTGSFTASVDFDPGSGLFPLNSAGNTDVFILKLDGSGNFVWAKRAGGTLYDYGTSVTLDNSGYAHLTGYFESTSMAFGSITLLNAGLDTFNIFIAKLDTSIITATNTIENFNNDIFLFPNPATKEIRVQSSKFKVESVEIYNVLGEKVFSQTTTGNQQTINVATLTPGIYFVKVKSEREEWVGKFVKE